LADDSGLSVDALGGAPGVHSAYYGGREGDREEGTGGTTASCLANLSDSRSAHYVCVMVLVKNAEDRNPLVAEGLWHGEIARAPRGANGFGYDPCSWSGSSARRPRSSIPFTKNRISHRGIALQKLVALLNESRRR